MRLMNSGAQLPSRERESEVPLMFAVSHVVSPTNCAPIAVVTWPNFLREIEETKLNNQTNLPTGNSISTQNPCSFMSGRKFELLATEFDSQS